MMKREGTTLSGWCLTDYHQQCHRPSCTCHCHGEER